MMTNEDCVQGMIDWLHDKDSDVRHYVALSLNWDFAEDVILWIVNQADCDLASAAALFWLSNPDEFLSEAPLPEGYESEGFAIFDTILSRAKAGKYARAELTWEDWIQGAVELYESETEEKDPFAVPSALLTPREGRAPIVPDALRVEHDQDLRRLFEGLGTNF